MAALRRRNALLTAKIESVEGTENAPSASTDAILCENLAPSFNPNVIQTNEHTASLDGAGPIVAGTQMSVTFDVFMKGSGTGGTAPEFGDLLKACGLAETLTGTAVPAAAEALGSGASTTAATLGSSASSTAQLYRGMPIVFTDAVTGTSLITDYTAGKVATLADTMGGTLTTTSDYQIPANARYAPASSTIPTLTMYFYTDGLLYKMVGARGTFTFSLDTRGIGRFSFTFTGLFLSKTDAAVPAANFDIPRPPPFVDAVAKYNRGAIAIATLQFDLGNTLALPDNPNAENGFDPAVITARRPTLTINPTQTLVATRDILADVLANTTRILAARLGTGAGNNVGLTVPKFQPLNEGPGDREGILTVDIPGEAVGPDAGFFLSFW